ncbi:MAG: AAA family ATPase [Candidatus Thorarchaeota archaeon]
MKLVIISGMPGAGKSELADTFCRAGIPVIVMGDVVREEAVKRGLEPNPDNTKKVMLDLREKEGLGAIAIHCVGKLNDTDSSVVVIEGCRSIHEIDVFDDYAESVTIISVHAAPSTRFERLRTRGRIDAPTNWDIFKERDLREISVGAGGVIALSDVMILNEGTIEELRKVSENVVKRYL